MSMEALAEQIHGGALEEVPRVRLLVADDDRLTRSLLSSSARDAVGEIVVLEAEDGAQAIQLGLQRRPEVALLDVNMPRLGGIEVAITLRELRPRMRLALHTADPLTHLERARANRLPLFSKVELDRTLAWLQTQVQGFAETRSELRVLKKDTFACYACGYGVVRAVPPERCPMCQSQNAWIQAPSRLLHASSTG
jgi:CheY-like chemotaxis protein